MSSTAILFEPHADDACLFAAFTCIRDSPLVITVLASQLQEDRGTGITNSQRMFENMEALAILGCANQQWDFADSAPDWEKISLRMIKLKGDVEPETAVFAPAVERGGHDQHNAVAQLALDVFGDQVRPYLTYVRGQDKTVGVEVVPQPREITLKLRALACYESQIREPTTRPWFVGNLREYVP